jgi:tetratricopeptide (TPR) repeat protein
MGRHHRRTPHAPADATQGSAPPGRHFRNRNPCLPFAPLLLALAFNVAGAAAKSPQHRHRFAPTPFVTPGRQTTPSQTPDQPSDQNSASKPDTPQASDPAQRQTTEQTAPIVETVAPARTYTEALRENNIGMALMDRHKYSEALGKFQTACVMNPESDTGCLNVGIAFLNMGRYDDAGKILAKSAERSPQNPRVWFNLALLEKALGQRQVAENDFQKAAALDPTDADTQYFLGYLAAEAQQDAQAIAFFRNAIALDPFHASAEYGLARLEQHSDDAHAAKAHLERFQHITSNRLGKPVEFVYGEQGKYSLAEEMTVSLVPAAAAIPVHFVNVTSLSGLPRQPLSVMTTSTRPRDRKSANLPGESLAHFLGSGACVFDYDGDGRPDIFLVNADGKGNAALFRNTGKGTFLNVTKTAKLEFHGDGTGCAVGDYDNDGHPDLVVASGNGITLFHNQGDGTFSDVTDAAGVRSTDSSDGLALGVTFIDLDQDGDLDLYVTRFNNFPIDNPSQPFAFPGDATPPGNILWHNKGDGTFVDGTKESGLTGEAPSVGALGTDLNNDHSVDLVLTGWEKFPTVLINSREGSFLATSPWAISMAGPAAGVVALDFDGDGWMDLAFTHWAPPGLSIWRNVVGKSFERVPLVKPDWMRGWGIATLDYDNDGRTDLVAVGETFAGEGRIVLLRNEGAGEQNSFRDVTEETGLDKVVVRNPRGVIAFDADGDGSTDLLITQNNLPPILLKSSGGNKNNWMELALRGDPDNASGIGTRIQIFSGAERQMHDVSGSSGYLGQGPLSILTGLGSDSSADVLRILWPSGTSQSEIKAPGGMRTPIPEAGTSESSE